MQEAPALGVRPDTNHLPLEFSTMEESIKIMGFWMFLVTDVLIFASLFAVYAVYHTRVSRGPTPAHLFTLGPALLETLLLLTSSFTVGLALFALRQQALKRLFAWLAVTLLLGAGFLATEIHEFASDVSHGFTWHVSGFLSGFFVLVGTHGAHVTAGIIWSVLVALQIGKRGLTPVTARKFYTFTLYWHFLDIVWVFIFTYVYLSAKLG